MDLGIRIAPQLARGLVCAGLPLSMTITGCTANELGPAARPDLSEAGEIADTGDSADSADTNGGDADRLEFAIPAQEDWTEHGVVLVAGESGAWDARLHGQISPCTVVEKDGRYLLYYVGADGDRSTDGGPRNRALGVAVSTDGITFTKHPDNPILTHLPHGNEEEGVFSAGATLLDDGTIALHYSGIWAANATTESVQGTVSLATSPDGLTFADHGSVLGWDDPEVWGYGDELFPLGAMAVDGNWTVYYGAKGNEASWDLGVATGSAADDLPTTAPMLTTHDVIGGADPVRIGPDTIALFIVRDFTDNLIEVRTASTDQPGVLSEPVATYTSFEPGYRHTTVHLDREARKWFMYQATDRPEDGNQIVVRTAPAVPTGE